MDEQMYDSIERITQDEQEPLRSQSNLKDVTMASADRIPDIEGCDSRRSNSIDSGYTEVQIENPGLRSNASTAQLIPTGRCLPDHRKHHKHAPLFLHMHGHAHNMESDEYPGQNSAPKCKEHRQCLSKCSFLFLIIFALIVSGLFTHLFYMVLTLQSKCDVLEQRLYNVHSSQKLEQDSPKLCLPCSELSQGPFNEDNPQFQQLDQRNEDGERTCCARTTTQLSVLLNLFAKRKQLEKCAHELLKDNITASPCNHTGIVVAPPARPAKGTISAHLQVGMQPPKTDPSKSDVPIRNWLSNKPGAHLRGIRIVDDKLVVPETGLYFLYSQVAFLVYYEQGQEPDTSGAQSLFHTLYRYNVIYPLGNEELLRSGVTQCWERQKDYGRYTNYIGASVMLNKGDQIYVQVSKIQFLSRESTLTYFGLFKLG